MNFASKYQAYLYAGLWLCIAIYLLVQGIKTKKQKLIYLLLSVFFFFMAAWFLINQFLPVDLFAGTYMWIFRGVCLAFLVFLIVVLVVIRRKKATSDDSDDE